MKLNQLIEAKALLTPGEGIQEKIPASIKTAFDEYGFAKSTKLEDALAVRKTSSWFAVLFQNKRDKTLYAIDFQRDGSKWEVSNDYIDIADMAQFKSSKLIQTFL